MNNFDSLTNKERLLYFAYKVNNKHNTMSKLIDEDYEN